MRRARNWPPRDFPIRRFAIPTTSRWIAKRSTSPVDVLMDVEPRNAETMAFPGRSLIRISVLGPMLARAVTEGKPVASDPFPLLRPDGPIGLVLAAPVLQEGATAPAGFVTFSYELAPLMLANDDRSLFSVVLKDPRDPEQRADRHRPRQRHLADVVDGRRGAVDAAEGGVSAAATGRSATTPRPTRRSAPSRPPRSSPRSALRSPASSAGCSAMSPTTTCGFPARSRCGSASSAGSPP